MDILYPTTFVMIRDDKIVAYGVQFESGKCVVNWTGEHSSIVVWPSINDLFAVNGHDNTKFFFSDSCCSYCMAFITPANKHYCLNCEKNGSVLYCQDCKKQCQFCRKDVKKIVKAKTI